MDDRCREGAPPVTAAMLLIQIAASQAGIGPFAGRGRESPQAAARHYQAALQRASWRREHLVV